MSDPRTALGGAAFTGLVTIKEAEPQGMISLKCDLGSTKLRKAATAQTGSDFPEPLTAKVEGDTGILWMAPDEILILVPYAGVSRSLGMLEKSLNGTRHLAVDVSDARAMFHLEGDEIREVLAKVAPLDLHPASFAPGTFRRTRLAQVAAALWLSDDRTGHVICFRSVARYVFDLLADAAAGDARVGFF